jgi:peptidoglycan/LPS O-acetylase OafA/YrhL
VFAPAILAFAYNSGPLSRVLKSQFLALLRLPSYSRYMIHPFAQSRVMLPAVLVFEKLTGRHVLGLRETADGTAPAGLGFGRLQGVTLDDRMIALLIVCSWITYHLLEAPGRNFARKLVVGGQGVRRRANRHADAGARRRV